MLVHILQDPGTSTVKLVERKEAGLDFKRAWCPAEPQPTNPPQKIVIYKGQEEVHAEESLELGVLFMFLI